MRLITFECDRCHKRVESTDATRNYTWWGWKSVKLEGISDRLLCAICGEVIKRAIDAQVI